MTTHQYTYMYVNNVQGENIYVCLGQHYIARNKTRIQRDRDKSDGLARHPLHQI